MLPADAAKPLVGARIVITRAKGQAGELKRRLEHLGATVLSVPAIAFAEPGDSAPLDSAIRSLGRFDWLIFTSANAVQFFAARCRFLGLDRRDSGHPQSPKIACVGPATAQTATAEGFGIDYVAQEHRGEALARELGASIRGKRVLLPRSARASVELPAALSAAGANVSQVVAYETLDASQDEDSSAALDAIHSGNVDVISFFSPSAFHSIETQMERCDLEHTAIAAIGPTTAATIREAGFTVAVEARESTTDGLIAALTEYFASKASQGART